MSSMLSEPSVFTDNGVRNRRQGLLSTRAHHLCAIVGVVFSARPPSIIRTIIFFFFADADIISPTLN